MPSKKRLIENPKDLITHTDCMPGSLKYMNRSLNEAPIISNPISVGINKGLDAELLRHIMRNGGNGNYIHKVV